MKASRWYKAFGGGREEKYYHILDFDEDETVQGVLYVYNSLFRKVVQEEERHFDRKWWMEQELYNTVHEVPESSIPFLMKF